MVECDYCDESFASEAAYLDHLEADHLDDLGAIDRRRVDTRGGDGGYETIRLLAVGVGIVALVAALLGGTYLILGEGSDSGVQAQQTPYGSQHVHGTMAVTIDGEEFDFTADPDLINQGSNFHFHGDSDLWHAHARGVTLEYALATIGIEVEDGGTRLGYAGETYDDADPDTNVSITVDGEPVDPITYVLQGVGPENQAAAGAGDDVHVLVEREG